MIKTLERILSSVKRISYAALIGGTITSMVLSASARTIFVPNDYASIQSAIASSTHEDEIVVSTGTYIENINISGKNIILRSTNPQDQAVVSSTIIDGSAQAQTVTFGGTESASCELSGFTICNGNAPNDVLGGGIVGNHTHATIQNNIIRNNVANWLGGGIGFCDGIIQNNVIENNRSLDNGGRGGGLVACQGTIQNNLILFNSATRGGGGFHYCNAIILRNNIIWNNFPLSKQIYNSSGFEYSCIQNGHDGIGNISTDPIFASPETGDFHLLPESPCIDAGASIDGLIRDFDGNPRPVNGSSEQRGDGSDFDIGADELYIPPTQTFTPTNTLTFAPTFTPTLTPLIIIFTPIYPTKNPTGTPTSTNTFAKTTTPTNIKVLNPTHTFTNTPTETYTNTPSFTGTFTPTITYAFISTETSTPAVTSTFTETPTYTPTFTNTFSNTPTPTNTKISKPTLTFTNTPRESIINTPTYLSTFTPTFTSAFTPSETYATTFTSTSTFTQTATITDTPTITSTETPTPSFTPIPTPILNPDNYHRYMAVFETKKWGDANIAASNLHYDGIQGHLATLISEQENKWVQNNLDFKGNLSFWIGGIKNPDWQWINADLWSYTNWNPSEPNNSGNYIEYYVSKNGTWNDQFSWVLLPYIVEFDTKPVPTPTATITDTQIFTPTETDTATPSPTFTDLPTMTYTPTFTETQTPTSSYTNTLTPTYTLTPSPTDSQTPTETFTPSFTSTFTRTNTSTITNTPFPSLFERCDFNKDGSVNNNDLMELIQYKSEDNPKADINLDGVVDCIDILMFQQAWYNSN